MLIVYLWYLSYSYLIFIISWSYPDHILSIFWSYLYLYAMLYIYHIFITSLSYLIYFSPWSYLDHIFIIALRLLLALFFLSASLFFLKSGVPTEWRKKDEISPRSIYSPRIVQISALFFPSLAPRDTNLPSSSYFFGPPQGEISYFRKLCGSQKVSGHFPCLIFVGFI